MNPNPDAVVTLQRLAGHVALVTLNRPQARNAVNGEVAAALEAIVDETERDADIWAVVLTGAREGLVFCAGADLKEVSAGRGEALFTARGGFAGFVDAPRSKPWIAAVHGKALAGGCEIVLACDLVVAADDAAFGLPEVTRGLIAAAGGLYRLPRALPRQLALELILTADTLPAAEAHRHGWVNRLAPAERVVDEALALAGRITRNAPVAVRESLQIARQAVDLDDAGLRALSMQGRTRVQATEDYREGPRAFIEKRAPRWTGR
ncbi:MAG: enoyl-CoA hydratase/isomerase family protein [Burkholderiales bacterium]|jgi:enoyl-CoA hydratase|nr:enoyl-CoA hydratase/isomerase family protein [Burkholderiales bacterium]